MQLAFLMTFAQFLSYLKKKLSYHIGIIFSKNVFSFVGRVPTTAYLIAQHTSYEYQMMNEMKLKQALFGNKQRVSGWCSNEKGASPF